MMLKKVIAVCLFSVALVGCNDNVSGKFSGTWVEPNANSMSSIVTITAKGDHYEVNHVDPMMNRNSTFDVKEDSNYLRTTSSNRIEYTLISPNELAFGNNKKVMWIKK